MYLRLLDFSWGSLTIVVVQTLLQLFLYNFPHFTKSFHKILAPVKSFSGGLSQLPSSAYFRKPCFVASLWCSYATYHSPHVEALTQGVGTGKSLLKTDEKKFGRRKVKNAKKSSSSRSWLFFARIFFRLFPVPINCPWVSEDAERSDPEAIERAEWMSTFKLLLPTLLSIQQNITYVLFCPIFLCLVLEW